MAGKHKPGYRAPRTGQMRKTRQPFVIDGMNEKVRAEIQQRRAKGETWQEISDASLEFAGRAFAVSLLQRWYDVRVEQVHREVMAQSDRARELAAAFTGKDFEDLPEAAMNALSSQVFAVMESKGGKDFEASLGNLVFILSGLIRAQSTAKRVELEKQKIGLAQKKFDQLKSKADKLTNDAAKQIGKGRALTVDDIDRIRERTFGLGPVKRSAPAGPPA